MQGVFIRLKARISYLMLISLPVQGRPNEFFDQALIVLFWQQE
jgi:hypothetical protein